MQGDFYCMNFLHACLGQTVNKLMYLTHKKHFKTAHGPIKCILSNTIFAMITYNYAAVLPVM